MEEFKNVMENEIITSENVTENETPTPLKDADPTENPDEIVTEIVTEIGKPRHILDKTESYLSKNLDTLGLLSELLISARYVTCTQTSII